VITFDRLADFKQERSPGVDGMRDRGGRERADRHRAAIYPDMEDRSQGSEYVI
jgi:hypothetical protein